MKPFRLHGDGIVLRPWTASDAVPADASAAGTRWLVAAGANAWDHPGAAFSIRDPGTGRLLGGIGLGRVDEGRRQAEVGCWVARPAGAGGTAPAAVESVAAWAFGSGIRRLELLAAKDDPVGLRAALGAGFHHEGVRRGAGAGEDGRYDLVAFARLSGDQPGPAARLLPDLPGGMLTDGMVDVRPLRPSDMDDYLALHLVPDVADSHFGAAITKESARSRCDHAEYRWLVGEMADCVIAESATGAFAGLVQLFYREPFARTAMVGYSLAPPFRGKGFATRAVELVTDWACRIGVARVVAGTAPHNVGSRAVLYRAGFEREAYFEAALPARDGTWVDNVQYVHVCSAVTPPLRVEDPSP